VSAGPEHDIWRAAHLLIRQHGSGADWRRQNRADLMRAALMGGGLDLRSKLERGDLDGQALWKRIRRTIVELQGAIT
jgi:hypothetical protein